MLTTRAAPCCLNGQQRQTVVGSLTMVFDAARGRVEDLDDDDFLEADSDENPSTPREPVRPATPKRSGGSGRKKKERSLPPRKLGALTKTHWEKSKAEQTAIEAAFAALDRDGDGSLLPQDIIEATQELGLHFRRPDIYQLVGEHDADGEGRLQAGEFRGIMIEGVRDADTAEDYDLLWAEFDRDGAGYVDVAALATSRRLAARSPGASAGASSRPCARGATACATRPSP